MCLFLIAAYTNPASHKQIWPAFGLKKYSFSFIQQNRKSGEGNGSI